MIHVDRTNPDHYSIIRRHLEKLASDAPEAKAYHWLHNEDECEDSTENYCYDCAAQIRAQLIGETEAPTNDKKLFLTDAWGTDNDPENIVVDGGWSGETDGFRFCARCGAWLHTELTDYGFEEELETYEEYLWTRDGEGPYPLDWALILSMFDHVRFWYWWENCKYLGLYYRVVQSCMMLVERYIYA